MTRVALRFLPAFLCLAIGVIQTSCIPVFNGCIEGQPNCAYADWVGRIEVTNPHFEFVQPGLTASKNFWLKDEDQLRFKWDDYAILFHSHGYGGCDFTAPTLDTDKCQRCRYCNQNTDECEAQPVPNADSDAPALVFLGLDSTNVIRSDFLRPSYGCLDGHAFTPPAQNCTVQLKAQGGDPRPLIEAQAFVLSKAQTVTYALQELDQSSDSRTDDGTHPRVKFYSGAVPPYLLLSGPGLEDNFSKSLHITKVRILKVTKQVLPVKGRAVMDAIPVLPSRLAFISGFQDGANVYDSDGNLCYVDATKADGDFDLTKCRGAIGAQGEPLDATPAFLGSATGLLLTWVVEFRESEGAMQPVLDPGNESLAIEFTIEPK